MAFVRKGGVNGWIKRRLEARQRSERIDCLDPGAFITISVGVMRVALSCATFCTRNKDVCSACTLSTPESALSGHRPVLLAPGRHSRCQLIWLVRSFVAFRATDS